MRILTPAVSPEDDPAMPAIVEAVESHLADLNVSVERIYDENIPATPDETKEFISAQLSDPQVLAVLRCIPETDRYRVFIYLANTKGTDSSPTARGIEVAGAEGTGETLGVILHASISVLLDRPTTEPSEPSPVPEVAAPPPSPVPPPVSTVETDAPPPEKKGRLFLDAAYEVGFPSSEWSPLHGAYFAAGLRIFEYVRIHVSYSVTSRYRIQDDTLELEIRKHPVGIGVMFFLRGRFVEPRLRLSAVIDYASTDLTLKDDIYTSDTLNGQMQISFQPRVEIGVRLYKNLQFYVGFGFDAYVLRPKYTVKREEGVKTIFDPLPVQPNAIVGLSAGFF